MPSASGSGQASKKPIAPMLVGLAMFLFFPLGLYLLWQHPTLGKNAKWWASGIAWACVVMLFSGRAEKEGETRPDKAAATVTQTEKPDNSTAAASGGSRKAPKKSNRKPPSIKIKLDGNPPEVQAGYKEGFDIGVALANERLDDIEAKAGRVDAKKYINAHPEVSAALEEQQTTMWKLIGNSAGNLGRTLADLASRGVAKNLNKHPAVVEADRSHHFILGKSHAFDAIISPLLKD